MERFRYIKLDFVYVKIKWFTKKAWSMGQRAERKRD
jgi:hypothetical protein